MELGISCLYIIAFISRSKSTNGTEPVSRMTHLSDLQWKAQISLGIVALIGLQVLLALHLRMNPMLLAEPSVERIEEYNPELFKVMSFGQLPAVIDWMWIKTLQDPLITHVAKGEHPSIFYTLDLITELDPAFFSAYTSGCNSGFGHPG